MGVLKLGGIASGLDTEGLIKQLMAVERRPVALLEQRKSELVTGANAWRDLNSRLLTLQNRLTELKSLTTSTWTAKAVAVTDGTILSAKAGSAAVPGTYGVQVNALATGTVWQSNLVIADPTGDLGQTGTILVTGGPGDGETFSIAATDSLNDIAKTINDDKARLGLTASVLQVNPGDYRLILTGQNGSGNDFSLSDSVGTAGDYLQITAGTGTKIDSAANAQVVVNGITVNTGDNQINGVIPGVTVNILKTGTTTVTVSRDIQKAVDAVKAFVDQYNSVLDFMDTLTKYDAKAKKGGTLLGETAIQSLRSALAARISDPVATLDEELNSLALAGVSTERFVSGGSFSGKLNFDETKFRAALEQNPEGVQKLFTLDDGTNKGVAVRAVELLSTYSRVGGIMLNKAKTLEDVAQQTGERIAYQDQHVLPKKEQRLRDQFIALEKAISLFQSQGAWLTAQLESMKPVQR